MATTTARDRLRDQIRKATLKIDNVPPGWKTSVDFAKELGYTQCHTRCVLRQLKDVKKAEVKEFRVLIGDKAMKIKHYKLLL